MADSQRGRYCKKNIEGLPENAPELRLASLLDEYRGTRELRLSGETRRTQSASGLLICGLQQRLLSSVEAFSKTLYVHRRTVKKQREAALAQEATAMIRGDLLTGSVASDDDRALLSEQELAAEEEAQIIAASEASLGNSTETSEGELFAREQQLLDQMTELAESSRALPDARVKRLVGWIKSEMCPDIGEIDSVDLEGGRQETVEEELEVTREREVELRAQIERLSTMLARSQESLSFSTDHFRPALSCSLEVMGADPLKPAPNGNNPGRSVFPALDQRPGADPSWAETMDSLRAPRPRDQKFWEWRRTSPIRPVVFEDPGVVTEEVVQMHLEQRVVQRLLSRFTAQGFVHHDLSRACMAQTTDAVPAFIDHDECNGDITTARHSSQWEVCRSNVDVDVPAAYDVGVWSGQESQFLGLSAPFIFTQPHSKRFQRIF